MNRSFSDGLIANAAAEEYGDKLMLYGQFVGDWVADTIEYGQDGYQKHSQWDIRFEWILEGRAIQDLWITPVRAGNPVGWNVPGNRYSTTMRIYDPKIDAWHIIWINPPSGTIVQQISRQVGDEIVQLGPVDAFGHLSRWIYRDITSNSFRWCSEKSIDHGQSWTLIQEMRAVRK